jgi:outer membrane protein
MTKSVLRRNLILRNSLVGWLAVLLLNLPSRLPAQEIEIGTRHPELPRHPLPTVLLLNLPSRLPAQEIEIGTRHPGLPRHPLTLQDCIAIALGESPKLEASRLDLLAAGEEIRAARASLWPNLTGSATGEAFSGESTGIFVITAVGPSTGGISAARRVSLAGVGLFGLRLDYPVFKDGSIFGLNDAPIVEIANAKRNALAWTVNLSREEVIYRVTQDFIETVSAQNRIKPSDRRVALLQRSVDITKEEQQKGLLLPIDVKIVTEQLNGARSLSKVIHEQATAGALGLAQLLGLPSSTHLRLESALPELPPTPDATQMFHTLLALHPSLQVQRANVEKAKQDYRLERFRLYPTVTAHGSAFDVSDFTTDAHNLIGGITVSIPIFDFGAQRATVRARKYTYSAEQARLGSVADDLVNELVTVYEEIDLLTTRILTLQGEIGKLDRDLRVAQSQQQQGIATPLTAIDAELSLVAKQDELAIAQARRLALYADLQRAMGGTWKWIR